MNGYTWIGRTPLAYDRHPRFLWQWLINGLGTTPQGSVSSSITWMTFPPDCLSVEGMRALATTVFAELGVPVAVHKTESPSTQVTFLGF